ncbi:hypothetical protein COU74_00935 [Candidatus Peregrinibacteria bacterium CG10_big_fil_rev_8_21_14_0_10_36_19]|nr:MAG: hypothetical protein COU74_00935 [Candidatus Peregrinibacteria bacterium CG10_big_fil_rev_8_21_14_0_10_36_19]
MKNWLFLGRYLNREIHIANSDIGEINKILEDDINKSVILIFIGKIKKSESVVNLFKQVIKYNPLAIRISGENSFDNFNQLLDIDMSKNRHIMTYVTKEKKITKCIEDFIFSTWPSEEYFIEWKNLCILTLNDNESYLKIVKYFKQKL